MNQWRNISAVFEWYNKIPDKTQCSSIQFYTENFYPSIKRELINKAIEFAKTITDITDEDLSVIMNYEKHYCLAKNCHG